jgi:thioredoxin-dependent peroxiredoxin
VSILGVSFDTPETNAKFVAKNAYPFPILSDADRSMALAYGAATSADAKHAARVSARIGADGRVEALYPKVDPKTHAETILKEVGPSSQPR